MDSSFICRATVAPTSVALAAVAAHADDHCGSEACGCTCVYAGSSTNPWVHVLMPVSCSSLGGGFVQDPALFESWKSKAGTPNRLRESVDALEGFSWSGGSPETVGSVPPGVLNAPWYPANLLTLGASGATGAGFPAFSGWRGVPFEAGDPENPDPGTDPRTVIGLTPVGIDEENGERPMAYIEFAEPMRAVWVELRQCAEAERDVEQLVRGAFPASRGVAGRRARVGDPCVAEGQCPVRGHCA